MTDIYIHTLSFVLPASSSHCTMTAWRDPETCHKTTFIEPNTGPFPSFNAVDLGLVLSNAIWASHPLRYRPSRISSGPGGAGGISGNETCTPRAVATLCGQTLRIIVEVGSVACNQAYDVFSSLKTLLLLSASESTSKAMVATIWIRVVSR